MTTHVRSSMSFDGFSWNFYFCYIKNVEAYHVSFSLKKQVLKKLLPKSLWQTYMKWTVVWIIINSCQHYRLVCSRLMKFPNSVDPDQGLHGLKCYCTYCKIPKVQQYTGSTETR